MPQETAVCSIILCIHLAAFVIDRMELPESLRRNVTLRNYHAGHMLFTHDEGRRQFRDDAKAIYESVRSPLKSY
jgi:carboxypeptidase C (cathepsin A)